MSGRFIQIYVNKIFRSVFEDKVLSFLTVAGGGHRDRESERERERERGVREDKMSGTLEL